MGTLQQMPEFNVDEWNNKSKYPAIDGSVLHLCLCFGLVTAVILNQQSIDKKQLCCLMSLPSVRLALVRRHHYNNNLMNHCHTPSQPAVRDISLEMTTECPTPTTVQTSSKPRPAWSAPLRPAANAQPSKQRWLQCLLMALTIKR